MTETVTGTARLRRWWKNNQWPFILAIGVASIVLGMIGWRQQLDAAGLAATPIDAFYLTIQLFTLQVSGVPDANGFPPALQIARFLAPAVAGYAAFRAFLAVFREATQRLFVRFARDHVVVCGLSDTGLRMVQNLRAAGRTVVAIELSDEAPAIPAATSAGARVVIGDARDSHLLARVGLDRATHVLALCGDDAVNGEVALAVAAQVADRPGTALDCRVHVADLGLSARLRTTELGAVPTPGVDIDFFNLFESGARTMFARNRPFGDDAENGRVAIVGDGHFAQAAIVELSRLWSVAGSGGRLDLVLVAADGEASRDALELRFPRLADICAMEMIQADPEAPDLDRLIADGETETPVYVCVDDEVDGLAVGLALAGSPEPGIGPVVVLTERDRGLGSLVVSRTDHEDRSLRPFGLLDAACDPAVLFGGLWETLARAVHEGYLAEARARGETAETNPSVVPWSALPETLRGANRDQARHIGTKLRAIGARPVPLVTAGGGDDELTEDEIETLSMMEHDRWCDDRRRNGWTLGPKDHDALTSPHLVPWDDLDEPTRELDRDAVRSLPRLLALAGHRIERTGETPSAS